MKVSKALQDVWDMKRAAYEETRQLAGVPYFEYIHAQVQGLLPPGKRLGVVSAPHRSYRTVVVAPAPAQVAKAAAVYRVRKSRKTAKV